MPKKDTTDEEDRTPESKPPKSPSVTPTEKRGSGPELNDLPPPSDSLPPQVAAKPAEPWKADPNDPWRREGTAKNYPPGAPDTPEGPLSHDEVRQARERGVDLEPKAHPSEVNANPGQNQPPPSAQFPDAALRRSDEMQGIPDGTPPQAPAYINTPQETDKWVPPSDRPVPGDWAKERSLADVPDTLRKLASHIREKKAAASAAPFSIEDECKNLEALADFVEGETSDGKGQIG